MYTRISNIGSFSYSIIAIDNAVKVEGVPDIPKMMAAETERYLTQFVATYAQLLDEKPVTCASTHTEYPALSAPTMLVVDVRCNYNVL